MDNVYPTTCVQKLTTKTKNSTSIRPIVFCKQFHLCHFAPQVRESKTVLDFGSHAVDYIFQVLDISFYQWELNSGFHSLLGFQFPCAGFRIPNPRIPDSTSKHFPNSLSWTDTSVFPFSASNKVNRRFLHAGYFMSGFAVYEYFFFNHMAKKMI